MILDTLNPAGCWIQRVQDQGSSPVTAYTWAVDNPEMITSLVQDSKAFVTVIAAAEAAPVEQQQVAVREAFTAGRPQQPGASWSC